MKNSNIAFRILYSFFLLVRRFILSPIIAVYHENIYYRLSLISYVRHMTEWCFFKYESLTIGGLIDTYRKMARESLPSTPLQDTNKNRSIGIFTTKPSGILAYKKHYITKWSELAYLAPVGMCFNKIVSFAKHEYVLDTAKQLVLVGKDSEGERISKLVTAYFGKMKIHPESEIIIYFADDDVLIIKDGLFSVELDDIRSSVSMAHAKANDIFLNFMRSFAHDVEIFEYRRRKL